MINERLLQFIWQFRYYTTLSLHTVNHEPLQIINAGLYNTNQGPDFLNAQIKIGKTLLAGHIELHILASHWKQHNHVNDPNYNNIILHVVWQNNLPAIDANGNYLPTLELQNIVSSVLLQQYKYLMEAPEEIACKTALPALSEMGWVAWKERLAIERLQQRSAKVLHLLDATGNHWEEVAWRMVARNFGAQVNTALFENVAVNIPIQILAKHKNQIHQVEALLMGQANMLQKNFEEDYPIMLRKEYDFLQKKHQLPNQTIQPAYLRMRPANFPSIRLAQLAMLVHTSQHLFSRIKEATTIKQLQQLFEITANDYWHYHYRLDEKTVYKPKTLGIDMANNIIINSMLPLLFTYGLVIKDNHFKEKALRFLQELQPESNNIIKEWKRLGVKCANAFDTQALIELTKKYCNEKRCLQCAVGNKILGKIGK